MLLSYRSSERVSVRFLGSHQRAPWEHGTVDKKVHPQNEANTATQQSTAVVEHSEASIIIDRAGQKRQKNKHGS